MKTILIGSNGQLGKDLGPMLSGEVLRLTRQEVDITDHANVRERVLAFAPDLVVNCSAYNLVDKSEADPSSAFAVNLWGVQNLAKVCREVRCRLVHFSSDYVYGFDESCNRPHGENDSPGPVSNYGLSKLAGEHAIRAVLPDALIIRTCGLYGHHGIGGKGGNFVETMKRIGREKGAVRVVADQQCTPTSTLDLADATIRLIDANATGLVHVTNRGFCTWYDFATEIFKLSGLTVQITPITSAEFGAPARRPKYSVLDCARYERLVKHSMPHWQNALSRYLTPDNS